MNHLSPSILSADYAILGQQLATLDRMGVDYVHIDIADGNFVPSLTIGFPVVKTIRKCTNRTFDVHMMVREPLRYVDELAECGADIITVHAEACNQLDYTVDTIRRKGLKVGVALSPETPLAYVQYLLPKLDMVLLMTVNPGFGGQKLIPYTIPKVRELKDMIDAGGYHVDIEVDGGVNLDNVQTLLNAGANVIVTGSALFGDHFEENIQKFLQILKGEEA